MYFCDRNKKKRVMKRSYYRTDYLFSCPSVIAGLGSILSVFFPYYEYNMTREGKQADMIALESDFGTIGNDIQDMIDLLNK